MPTLTIADLLLEARRFADLENMHNEPSLYGVNDGKAIGSYLERKFARMLALSYNLDTGNAASGIDLPGLNVDLKTTSVRQPQSSCPFRSARQKVYGLGYHLLVFVYAKSDDPARRTACLAMRHVVFIEAGRTADFQMTSGLRQILANNGSVEDIVAFMLDRNLPVDEIGATSLAEEIIANPPAIGWLTISNAQQWRLQYQRALDNAHRGDGVVSIL
jgi:hypothetical protein